ncbi:hypothetical protein KXS11_12725 [Plantibacter flavus]|uniref:hypothetical protein n=1 Tax=Plantibacter flavus TaxID=150123 RepID=UPI003F1363BD
MAAQVLGGIAGTVLAGSMFDTAPSFSTTDRVSAGSLLGEVVATAGLILVLVLDPSTSRSTADVVVPHPLEAKI